MRTFPIALATATLIAAGFVSAQDSAAPDITFNAYGTLGLVYSSEDQADFVGSLFQSDGAGHSDNPSVKVDSRLGLQITAAFNPRLTGIVQVVTEQEPGGDFEPTVEWANLKYDFTPDLSIRVGRMVQPTFMVSEFRKVGYATPWVRPPEEVYRMVPVTNFDGADFRIRHRFGNYINTLTGSVGRVDTEFSDGSDVHARNAVTLSNTLEWNDFSLFASVGRYQLTLDALKPFFDTFRQFGPKGAAIAERYDADDSQTTIVTAGARYDRGDWFIMGELGGSDSESFIGDPRGGYVTGGYRIGDFTPFATFAKAWTDSDTSDPGLSTEGLPPSLAQTARQLNVALNDLLNSAARQNRFSLGTRWDFAPSMALTAQYEYLDLDSESAGLFINTQPDFRSGGSASLVSLTFDFVY